MEDARITQAMGRIEAALTRIERSARKASAQPHESSELAEKHEALKRTVAASLSDLDHLIEGLER